MPLLMRRNSGSISPFFLRELIMELSQSIRESTKEKMWQAVGELS